MRAYYSNICIEALAYTSPLATQITHNINQKTKPLGALGKLERLAKQICLIQCTPYPCLTQPTVLVFASDHGIANSGVSPYPQVVTAQMVRNFLQGGAGINVFAKQYGFNLRVIDAGVNHVFEPHPQLIDAKIAMGTVNFLQQAAMTTDQCEQALTRGAQIAEQVIQQGCNVLALGEMGIGNTSSASCLMSTLCGLPIDDCVGRGTGLDDVGLAKKTALLAQSLQHHGLQQKDTMLALETFGGFEIAMMVGAMLKAGEKKVLLLIDGFIATSALLIAHALQPHILDYCVFCHCSDEAGHQRMLQYLSVQPLLNLGLRLGEGTGAVLAYPLVQSAVNFLNEMASFQSAQVSEQNA